MTRQVCWRRRLEAGPTEAGLDSLNAWGFWCHPFVIANCFLLYYFHRNHKYFGSYCTRYYYLFIYCTFTKISLLLWYKV